MIPGNMTNATWKKLANEYVVSLFPVFMLVDGFRGILQQRFGLGMPVAIKIQGRAVEYYYQPGLWERAHNKLVSRIRKDPRYLRKIYLAMEKKGNRLVRMSKPLTRVGPKQSDSQLWRLYKDFVKGNLEVYSYGLILPLLDYQHSAFLTDELTAILKRRRAENKFLTLTTPLEETNLRRQDLDLLRLFAKFRRNPVLLRLLKDLPSGKLPDRLAGDFKPYWCLLKEHTANYNWVYYVYEGPAAEPEYFLDIIKDQMKRGIDPARELAKFEKKKNRLRREQAAVTKSLKLSAYERQIVGLARDSVVYKPWRRELQSHAYYHAEFLLREIGRRLHLSLAQVRMLLPHEVRAGLLGRKVDIDEINGRLKFVVYGAPTSISCLAGEKARVFSKKHFPKERLGKLPKILSGTPAYKGRARGRVCIVNSPDDMEKMREGDILVSATTNPNLMPAIRKAAAIVTDEGGLTCHASIVSRELEIPCVVGLKIATQVFRDGDRVEVDATKGVVKKV